MKDKDLHLAVFGRRNGRAHKSAKARTLRCLRAVASRSAEINPLDKLKPVD
jgi:hypothetical protein